MKRSSVIISALGASTLAIFVAAMTLSERSEESTAPLIKPSEASKANETLTNQNSNKRDHALKSNSTPSSSPPSPTASIELPVIQSKLADYPGFGHQDEEDEETFSKEELQRENLIADCMKDNGFEYTPAPSIVVDGNALDDQEEFERLLAEAAVDPNQAYVNTLSSSSRDSYYLALTGLPDPNVQEGYKQSLGETNTSCISIAFSKVPGVFAKRNELRAEYNAMETDLKNDPDLISTIKEWSNCMSNANLSFQDPSNVHEHIDRVIMSNMEQNNNANHEQHMATINNLNKTMNQCIASTNLVAIKQQLRTKHENTFVDAYQEQLQQ